MGCWNSQSEHHHPDPTATSSSCVASDSSRCYAVHRSVRCCPRVRPAPSQPVELTNAPGGIREKMPELIIKGTAPSACLRVPESVRAGGALPPRPPPKKEPAVPPEQQVLHLAQSIFEKADADQSGEVDQCEMAGLVTNFFIRCNKQIPHDIATNMESITQETMQRFDK